jgi:DNA repair protein RAD50
VLSTKDELGRESSVSHKCADIEKLVPQLMGVSPAVLESVIFCHQEDSLWPLSDATTLKIKFDDIFAATRYTKALENIAKLRKEKAAEIKVMEAELKALEGNVEQAHKLEDDLEATKQSIAKKTDESDRLGEEVKGLEHKLAKLGVKQEEIRGIQDTIAALQAQKDVMIAEKTKANQRMITDYSDTDEELKGIYHNFRQTQVQLLKSIEEKAAKQKQLEAECVQSEAQMGKLSEDLGKLQAQEQDYKRKKQELLELANRLGGGAVANGGHSKLLGVLESSFANKKAELQTAKSDAQKLDSKWESELTALKKEESSMVEQAKMKTQQMDACKSKRSAQHDALAATPACRLNARVDR